MGAPLLCPATDTYDSISSLRIFATIDQVMEMLATELQINVPAVPAHRPWKESPILRDLPYTADGLKSESARLTLDLRPGSKLRVVNQPAWDCEVYGSICEVTASPDFRDKEGHISLLFGKDCAAGSRVRVLGRWWLDAAIEGSIDCLPVVPCE